MSYRFLHLQVGPFGISLDIFPIFSSSLKLGNLSTGSSLILKTLEQVESLDQIASLSVLNNY